MCSDSPRERLLTSVWFYFIKILIQRKKNCCGTMKNLSKIFSGLLLILSNNSTYNIHNTRDTQTTSANTLVPIVYICFKAIFILCLSDVSQYTSFSLAFHRPSFSILSSNNVFKFSVRQNNIYLPVHQGM